MAKLFTLLEQHLDRQPTTVVTQVTTWWETVIVLVKLQECGLEVHLPVEVCGYHIPTYMYGTAKYLTSNQHTFYLSTAVNCGTLSNPANGRVTHTAGTTFGQTATYSCNTGYNLVGYSTRTCQAARRWFGRAPTCQGVLSYTPNMHVFFIHDKPVCKLIGCLAWQIFLA